MIINDRERVKHKLESINYYRLSGYMIPYRKMVGGVITDDFRNGITWEKVYSLYLFDRKLRLLVFDAIERIEIAIRAQLVYQLSHKYGSNWQDKAAIFKPPYTRSLKSGKTITIKDLRLLLSGLDPFYVLSHCLADVALYLPYHLCSHVPYNYTSIILLRNHRIYPNLTPLSLSRF